MTKFKNLRMPWAIILFAFALLVELDLEIVAQEPYELVRTNPIQESWRWHELEALRDLYLAGGTEDEEGRLWFGYSGGILSYDGHVLEKFSFPDAFANARTHCVSFNVKDDILVFTSLGLLRFEREEWKVLLEYHSNYSIPRLLVAKNSHGLTVLATPIGLYQLEKHGVRQVAGISHWVHDAAFDNQDNLWLAVENSANVLKISNTGRTFASDPEIKHYRFTELENLSPQIVYNAFEDKLFFHSWRPDISAFCYDENSDQFLKESLGAGKFYGSQTGSVSVGKYGFLLFTKSAIFKHYKGQWSEILSSEANLPASGTYAFRRRNGNLVIGGIGETIYEIDYANERWDSFHGHHFQCEGNDGHLWLISLEGGIVEYDPQSETALLHNVGTIDTPQVVLRADDGTIWAAGAHKGVAAISYYDGLQWIRNSHPELKHYFSYLSAISLDTGEVAFGSGSEYLSDEGGLVVYRPNDSGYEYSYVLSPLVPARIVGMAQTDPESLWLGGRKLLNIELSQYSTADQPDDLDVFWVDHISADKNGGLWAGTWERGLFHFSEGSWNQFGRKDGLKSEQVVYVLNDRYRENTIWVATRLGISRLDNRSWINDVLPPGFNFLREGGTLKQSSDGSLWMNFAKREWYYRHENSRFEFSSLKNGFKTVRYNPDSNPPEVRFKEYAAKFVAPANIRIAWEGADFWSVTPREKLEYSYRLDGINWSPFSTDTSVVLTGLSKGNHSFDLKVRDLDGNESQAAQAATFSVVPPVWQRSWFLLGGVLIVTVIAALLILLIRQRVNSILQMDEFRLQFFTNLSHELRTPISLILGPLEQFLSRVPKNMDTKPLKLVQRNAQKLHHLVEQILEFRRLDASNVQMRLSHADLIQVVKESIRSAKPLSTEKKQNIFLVSQRDACLAWFDTDAVDKILGNLILNAVKYTDEGGEIIVKVTIDNESDAGDSVAIITVEDNGVGIPEDKVSHIFEPFYRVGNSLDQKNRGSGLGLALVKNLVEICGGRIRVKSPIYIDDGKAKGSRFIVTLPFKVYPPSTTSIEILDELGGFEDGLESEPESLTAKNSQKEGKVSTSDLPKILIVEDDADMRSFIKSELDERYQILEARDGNSGLMVAINEVPDLIISDVMMPEMNGNEFCRRIKSDEITSHIPVFMLTALKASDYELKSLYKGADDFFTKPVSFPILKQRIRNLFENRDRLYERNVKLNSESSLDTKALTSNTIDELFLNRAVHEIEKHLADAQLDVEALAGRMHMSRMTLYRKFKALTGETPSHCLRRLRLKRARKLLETGALNVSEVSDQVGFLDVAYFCTLFKKFYGITPGEFMAKSKSASVKL